MASKFNILIKNLGFSPQWKTKIWIGAYDEGYYVRKTCEEVR